MLQMVDSTHLNALCPEETTFTGRKTNGFSLLMTSFSVVQKFSDGTIGQLEAADPCCMGSDINRAGCCLICLTRK